MSFKFSSLKTVTQASIGSAALLFILIIILAVSYYKLNDIENVASRITNLRTPTVDASSKLTNNTSTALANLRGWMLLQNEQFIIQRKESWKQIRIAQRELNDLSINWTNPENVTRLNEVNDLLDKFETSQDKVEHLAWNEKTFLQPICFLAKRCHEPILFSNKSPR